jgi:CSLREA domain-containing protein
MKTITLSILLAVVTLGVCSVLAAVVSAGGTRNFTVNTTSDTIVIGACDTRGPGCSLRGAIVAANQGGDAAIRFSIPASDSGCSSGVCTISTGSLLPAIEGADIAILGPGPDRLIIRPAPGVQTGVLMVNNASGTVAIRGVTISGGDTMTNPLVGGIAKLGAGSFDLIDSVVSDNRGPVGGVRVSTGTTRIIGSAIIHNTAAIGGGGLSVGGSATCNIINSMIGWNSGSAPGGGGIFAGSGGTTNITNSTIVYNVIAPSTGSTVGGGIRQENGLVTVKNSLIAANSAIQDGPDVFGVFVSAGFNLIGKTDGSTGFTAVSDLKGTAASPLDPRLDSNIYKSNGGLTPSIALLADSPAIDRGTSAGLGGPLATDQRGVPYARVRDNPLVPNAAGGDGTDIGAFERSAATAFDFDGDVKTDIGIFRPSDATWWINRSSTGVTFAAQFGLTTDKMVPADFTGDGKTDIAIWRPSNGSWFILRSEDVSFYAFPFGTNGDIPAPADFDNDGRADAAVFRPSNGGWFIQQSTGGTKIQQFGTNGDVPVPADYDGDGRADIAINRSSNGQWWLSRSTSGVLAVTFGVSTDKPVPGDFTGDGKTDVAVWRPSTGEWFVLRSENLTFFGFPFGTFGDVPAPGDYDGDGRFDATVFRTSNSVWFGNRTTAGVLIQQFGSNGDRPVANAFVP